MFKNNPPKIPNSFWKLKSSNAGRKRIFQNPKVLLNGALEYFKSVDENPWYETKPHVVNGEIQYSKLAKPRPYTILGLCLFLRISHDTLREYRKRPEFSGVIKVIDETIKNQKFEGAAAGFFNANIIARDLGLRDKVESLNHVVSASMDDPVEEMKKRGIPIPDIDLEDIEEN